MRRQIIDPVKVVNKWGSVITLGVCCQCGRKLTLSRANRQGARCPYEGAQFNREGGLHHDAAFIYNLDGTSTPRGLGNKSKPELIEAARKQAEARKAFDDANRDLIVAVWAGLHKAFGEEFTRLTTPRRILLLQDARAAALEDGCSCDAYAYRIGKGNLRAYVDSLVASNTTAFLAIEHAWEAAGDHGAEATTAMVAKIQKFYAGVK